MGSISDSTPNGTQTPANGTSPNIPIVDLSPFTSPSCSSSSDSSTRLKAAQDLVRACREVGFVYIKNHGVPQDQLDQAFALSKQFYDLPTEDKMKAKHPPGYEVHRGYSWPGFEKVAGTQSETEDEEWAKKLREVQDYKESFEIGSAQNPEQSNIWPPSDLLPDWQPFMTSFYWTCSTATQHILRALALGIGLDEDHLVKFHSGQYNQLRLAHYPPIPAAAVEGGKVGRMSAHTDWSTITILFQDECGGLQVAAPHPAADDDDSSGKFVDVDPVPGTCVMNVGDLLMRWSNDYLKSTQHRVQLPPRQDRYTGDERLTRARYSIPYFVTTDPDMVIECLTGRFEGGEKAKYEPITNREYSAMRARGVY